MGAIYANSYVTIAAADAKDCHEGCFLKHNKAYKQCEVPLPAGMQSQGTVYARPVPSSHEMDNWIMDETTVGDSVMDGRTARKLLCGCEASRGMKHTYQQNDFVWQVY